MAYALEAGQAALENREEEDYDGYQTRRILKKQDSTFVDSDDDDYEGYEERKCFNNEKRNSNYSEMENVQVAYLQSNEYVYKENYYSTLVNTTNIDGNFDESYHDIIPAVNVTSEKQKPFISFSKQIRSVFKKQNRKKSAISEELALPIYRQLTMEQHPSWLSLWVISMGLFVKKFLEQQQNFHFLIQHVIVPKSIDHPQKEMRRLVKYDFVGKAKNSSTSLIDLTNFMQKLQSCLTFAMFTETCGFNRPPPLPGFTTSNGLFPEEFEVINKVIQKYRYSRPDFETMRRRSPRINDSNLQSVKRLVFDYYDLHKFSLTTDDLYLANVGLESLYEAVSYFLEPGKNILLPAPSNEFLEMVCCLNRVQPRYYNLHTTKRNDKDILWSVDFEDLKSKIDERTVAIVLQNPNGCCGAVHTLEELEEIKRITEIHNLVVISNEYFSDLIFNGGRFRSFLEVGPTTTPVLIVNSCFKRLFHTTHNIGWIALYDKCNKVTYIRDRLKIFENQLTSKRLLEYDLIKELLDNHLPMVVLCFQTFVEKNMRIAVSVLGDCPGLRLVLPQGGWFMLMILDLDVFPMFESDSMFCTALYESCNVKLAPGSLLQCKNSIPLSLMLERHGLLETCERLNEFCRKHANIQI